MSPRLYVTAGLLPLAALGLAIAPVLSGQLLPTNIAPPGSTPAPPAQPAAASVAGIHVAATPDRDLVYAGDRSVRVRVDISADPGTAGATVPTDLVVVLDRSGSMGGPKIEDARAAAAELVGQLGPEDRIALVSFGSDVRVDFPLSYRNKDQLAAISRLQPDGGTDMVAGLTAGLSASAPTPGRMRRMVLVSDGRPNSEGGLDSLASQAARAEVPLSTIGIGADYDETLMERLASLGTGNFVWATRGPDLPQLLAAELATARESVASAFTLEVDGRAIVVDAGGIPVASAGLGNGPGVQQAQLGTVFAGQKRSLWLTMLIPASASGNFDLGEIEARWVRPDGTAETARIDLPAVQVTADQAVAWGRLGDAWAESQINEEFNRMRSAVSSSVQQGDQAGAVAAIEKYKDQTALMNGYAANPKVDANLQEVDHLLTEVNGTFEGPDQASKQNLWSKGTRVSTREARQVGSVKKVAPAPAPSK